jgi:hypothetical protein
VVLDDLHQYFFQRARKLAQNLLNSDSDLIETSRHAASSPLTSVAVRRHLVVPSSLSTLSPCVVHRPLSSLVVAPPLLSCCVVPCPSLSRLRPRSEGTAASPHPSSSCRRRGKIQSIVVVLRSDDDASRRPPPPHPLVAPSNICSRSRQRDNIAAPTIVAAARRTSILAKNAAAALLLARGKLFPTAAGRCAPSTPAPCHTPPPNNMLIVASLLTPDAAALLPRQHHVRRPTPPPSRPDNTAGVVALVAMAPSTTSRWRHPRPRLSGERVIFSCLFGEKILSSAPS